MSTLREYLQQKRAAIETHRVRARQEPPRPHQLRATVSAEGRSGIRRIRIRDFQVVSDSGPDCAGYDLGPSSEGMPFDCSRDWALREHRHSASVARWPSTVDWRGWRPLRDVSRPLLPLLRGVDRRGKAAGTAGH